MFFSRFKNKKKVIVVGIDGFPYSLFKELEDKGIMKSCKAIINGKMNKMETTYPEISSIAWSSFMTGKNPGEHNIFGFIDIKPGTYDIFFPNFNDLRADTIWKILDRNNKKSLVINQPATYPAKEINGLLISGFVAIDLKKSIAPVKYYSNINKSGYEIDIDTSLARKDSDYLFEALNKTLNTRVEIGLEYYKKLKPDYFEFIITGTDRLQHFKWNSIHNVKDPYHKDTIYYYKHVDNVISELYSLTDKNTLFILLSDHGFTALKKEIYINKLLEISGYLKFKGDKKYTEISEDTLAFALDPGRIFINRKGRFPKGSVRQQDVQSIIKDISDLFKELHPKESNERVITKIQKSSEIYSGVWREHSADIILTSKYGYDLKGSLSRDQVFADTDLQGMHTADDALVFINKKENPIKNIVELRDIILSHFSED